MMLEKTATLAAAGLLALAGPALAGPLPRAQV